MSKMERTLCIKIRQGTAVTISVDRIKEIREKLPEKTSQRKLADMLQRAGLDIDKNAVQRIESGKRFVTDIELKVIAEVLGVSYQDLLDY